MKSIKQLSCSAIEFKAIQADRSERKLGGQNSPTMKACFCKVTAGFFLTKITSDPLEKCQKIAQKLKEDKLFIIIFEQSFGIFPKDHW